MLGRTVLLLVLLFAATEALGLADTLEEFVANRTELDGHHVFGAGPAFATIMMLDAIFKFTISSNVQSSSQLVYYPLLEEKVVCRLDGYLEHCEHPFEGKSPSNSDTEIPFEVDFAISDEPYEDQVSDDLQNFPLFVMGIAPIFNIPGVENLVLHKDTLAKIFRKCDNNTNAECLPGSISSWNDSAILADNPPEIHPILEAMGDIIVIVEEGAGVAVRTFKESLAKFEDGFNQQIGGEPNEFWNGTDHRHEPTSYAVLNAVASTPGSISFERINLNLRQIGVNQVSLVTGHEKSVYPDSASLFGAFQEIGLAYGNDGTDPSKLRVDIVDALGDRAWPIAFIGYLVIRTNVTLHEYCVEKKDRLLEFLEFLYTHQGQDSDLFTDGFAPLTVAAGTELLEIARGKISCNGSQVYVPPPPFPIVHVQTDESFHDVMQIIHDEFAIERKAELIIDDLQSHLDIKEHFHCLANASCQDDDSGLIVLAGENLSLDILRDDEFDDTYHVISMPFCAMAVGFIHNFCEAGEIDCPYRYQTHLVLDLETGAKILDGEITHWSDAAIQALNPEKTLPNAPINVVAGPKTSTYHFDFVETIRRKYYPEFAYRQGGVGANTFRDAWVDVSLTQYSISFVVFNGTNVEGVERVDLVSRGGQVVPATPSTIEACAMDSYDEDTNTFFLSHSEQPDCYPLVQVFNLLMRDSVRFPTSAYMAQYLYEKALRKFSEEGILLDVTVLSVAELGTLVDLTVSGIDFRLQHFLELESITDQETGESILLVPHNMNHIPNSLVYTMYALLTLELIIYLGLAVWTVYYRNRKIVRNSSPIFMLQVLLGGAIMACTVIPLAEQDDYLYPRGMPLDELNPPDPLLDAACVAQPVLFSFGFFLTFSALFLKTWRLIRIFNNKKLRNLFLRDRQLLIYQLMVIAVVVILNLIWAIQDPLIWLRHPVHIDSSTGLVVESIGLCFSRTGVYPALPLLVAVMMVLAVGNYLSYLGRRIPTEFNESKWVAMTMVITLEAFVIGLPILVLANDQPVPGFIIKSLCSLMVSLASVALIFGPKLALAYGIGVDPDESNPFRFVKGSGSGSNNGSNSKAASGQKSAGVSHQGQVLSSNNAPRSVMNPSLNTLVEGVATAEQITDNLPTKRNSKEILSGKGNAVFGAEIKELKRSGSKEMMSAPNPSFTPPASPATSGKKSRANSKEFSGVPPSTALKQVLESDPMRRRFRRFLQTLKMEENVRFWDSLLMFRSEKDASKRYTSARAIIQTFIVDSSPLQVNLRSETRDKIMSAFKGDKRDALGNVDFFNEASNELFEDLRQSDAFRIFLENDTFSTMNLGAKSDPFLLVDESGGKQ